MEKFKGLMPVRILLSLVLYLYKNTHYLLQHLGLPLCSQSQAWRRPNIRSLKNSQELRLCNQ